MLKVVSNTTPILALLSINQLDLLAKLYDKVFIPQGVYQEIEKGKQKPFYADLTQIAYLQIMTIQNPAPLAYLQDLDRGEAETIVLANELKADLVIIDEKLGRYWAESFGHKITGTLGILVRAKKMGFISHIKPFIDSMQTKNIWFNSALIQKVLETVGEN